MTQINESQVKNLVADLASKQNIPTVPTLPIISNLVHDFNFGIPANMVLSGSQITQITDSVGSVVSSQATAGTRPTLIYPGGLNSLPYAYFNGSQFLTGSILTPVQEATIIIMMKQGGTVDFTYPGQGIVQNGNSSANGYGLATFQGSINAYGYRNMGFYQPGITSGSSDIPADISPNWKSYAYTQSTTAIGGLNVFFYDSVGAYHTSGGAGSAGSTPTTAHRIGGGFALGNFIGGIQRILVYNRALTQSEVISVMNYFNGYYNPIKPNKLFFEGDSITFGFGTSPALNYAMQASTQLLPSNYLITTNTSVSGANTGSVLARLSTAVLNQINPNVNNIFSLMIGHNQTVSTAADYLDIINICQQVKNQAGANTKIIIHTVINDKNAGTQTGITAMNLLIRANWPLFADALCDSNAIPQLSNANNLTYYQADGTHPTNLGQLLISNLLQQVIKGLLSPVSVTGVSQLPVQIPNTLALFTNYAITTLANSITETSLIPLGIGNVNLAIPTVGKQFRCFFGGIYSAAATAGTLVVKIKYNGTVIATGTVSGFLASAVGLAWDAYIEIVTLTVGASGTVVVTGGFVYSVANNAARLTLDLNNAGASTTINNSVTGLFDITGTWNTASTSNSITVNEFSLESLN